ARRSHDQPATPDRPTLAPPDALPISGIYTGTFDLPAGEYAYKVAVGGSWDESYGAGAVPGGTDIAYTHEGGPVTFWYDPVSHVRSEEHTSELQSRFELVCRLLREKKN